MTKKHYQALADIIRERIDWSKENINPEALGQVEVIAGELADYLEKENERFDRARFMTACGLRG